MEGRQISDDQWQQIQGFLPGRSDSVGVTARDNRLFVDGVLWVLRSGAEWKGKTCRKSTVNVKPAISATPAGPALVSGRRSFRCCWMIRTTGT